MSKQINLQDHPRNSNNRLKHTISIFYIMNQEDHPKQKYGSNNKNNPNAHQTRKNRSS